MDEIITLDYGSGGKKTARLIESMIVPAFGNPALDELGDGAVVPGAERLVFSTDSFVVDPVFFPGGDIGKLSVCGTVNDIAVSGGVPKYLSCAFIIEEGFELSALERIIAENRPHGKLCIGFTPDEEIGEGASLFDVEGFGAAYAYTVDGEDVGEISYENFNAAAAVVTVHGFSVHPGSAKNSMINAQNVAM